MTHLEIVFDPLMAAEVGRADCEQFAREREPSVALYWSLVVPVGIYGDAGDDLLATDRVAPGTTRIPLLKLAATLQRGTAVRVAERVELDFGGTVSPLITLERFAGAGVRLENSLSGVRIEVSVGELKRAVTRFNDAVAHALESGCPALLAAAIDRGWLLAPQTRES